MVERIVSIQKQLGKWVKSNDIVQSEWIVNYLIKQRYEQRFTGLVTYENLLNFYTSIYQSNPDKAFLLWKEMKAAWSQKANRDKNNGRKVYSFVMSTDVQKALKQLAKIRKLPMNITLEELIQDNASFKIQLQEIQKADVERLKLEFKVAKEKLEQKLNRQNDLHVIEVQKLKKENEMQHSKIEEMLVKIFKQHLILDEKKLVDSQLTKEQEGSVLEYVVKELNNFKKDIKLETDKISSFNHLFASSTVPR